MLSGLCVLFVFFAGLAMGNGDMALETLVDVFHHRPEDASVGAGIMHLVRQDIIVDHLMKYGVVDFVLWHIDQCGYAEDKVGILPVTKEGTTATAGNLSEIAAGTAGAKRQGVKSAVETETVELVELITYVVDGRFHALVG